MDFRIADTFTDSLLLCYVGHHDAAYDWAERRRLDTHPKTGAAQLVELATGGKPRQPVVTDVPMFSRAPSSGAGALPAPAARANPFEHPDAQRRFRLMTNVEELERALEFPWDKWTVFLHPAQRELVERDYSGPARVSGSAGTGKTIVALHRAVYLARHHPESRVLLTTFSEALANALRTRLRRLLSNEPRLAERLEVHAMDAIGQRLYERHFGRPQLVSREAVRKIIAESATSAAVQKFKPGFLYAEWEELVDAWQLASWESYRDVNRLGRKTRLPEAQRAALWAVFDSVKNIVLKQQLITPSGMYTRLTQELTARKHPAFDFVVVDEAQDVSVSQLRFLAALGANRPNGLFFAGDLGQRIFQVPFSWLSEGVDVRGRARTLHARVLP